MIIRFSENSNLQCCTLVNYANDLYKKLQLKNRDSALKIGEVTKVVSYSQEDIDKEFYTQNKEILDEVRGNGLWLWKPYFIKKELSKLEHGDYLFYCDSGSYFVSSIMNLITALDLSGQDIMPFELDFKESTWTKRDAFVLMGCDSPFYSESKHRLAGFILFRKSETSLKFVDEWLHFSQDKRIITNSENTSGLPNYDGFKENRHDQSVFSLLSKKYNLQAFRDPSQFGNYFFDSYDNSKSYKQLVQLTRLQKKSLKGKLKGVISKFLRIVIRN